MTLAADRIRTRRQAFAAPGSAFDVIVRWLAVGLPALVGVIAAMMLIAPLSDRGEVSFLLDRNKVAVADDRLRVDEAMYRGQDARGRPFSLTTGAAVQKSASVPVVAMQDLVARILLPEGPALLATAGGRYAFRDDLVMIPGVVRFTAADGYRMLVRNVTIDLKAQTLHGEGRVEGVIPAGSFEADSIHADLAARTLRLEGNARMRMVPGELRLPSGM